jgi:hypothetical protein
MFISCISFVASIKVWVLGLPAATWAREAKGMAPGSEGDGGRALPDWDPLIWAIRDTSSTFLLRES